MYCGGLGGLPQFSGSGGLFFGLLGGCDVSEVNILIVGVLIQEPALDFAVVTTGSLVELLCFLELSQSDYITQIILDKELHTGDRQTTVGILVSGDDCGTHRDGEFREILVEFCQFTELGGGRVLCSLGESLGQGDGVLCEVDRIASSLFYSKSFLCCLLATAFCLGIATL